MTHSLSNAEFAQRMREKRGEPDDSGPRVPALTNATVLAMAALEQLMRKGLSAGGSTFEQELWLTLYARMDKDSVGALGIVLQRGSDGEAIYNFTRELQLYLGPEGTPSHVVAADSMLDERGWL
jgi:hypothetical protein